MNCRRGFLQMVLSLGALLTLHAQTPPPTESETPIATATPPPSPYTLSGQGIIVRTTENVTNGGWLYLLNQCHERGISRIDLLVKQDEDNFKSPRTGQTLQSGELLVPLPNEKTAAGWENADWLKEMLARAKEMNIKIFAWWPCFHDAQMAAEFPDAAYKGQRGEMFVDAGDPRVQYRQEDLLAKLLNTYPFDGVSLDWIRYAGWWDGSDKITGFRFEHLMHFKWGRMTLDSDYNKARWYEFRAAAIADWVAKVVHNLHEQRPDVRFGAFLLPPEFTEQSQNYPMLERSGLDFIQPMGYWADWKKPPQWIGENIVGPYERYLVNGATFWPAIGIDQPPQEIATALKSLPPDAVTGVSFFTYGTWEQHTFDKLRDVVKATPEAQRLFASAQTAPSPTATAPVAPPSTEAAYSSRIQPKDFPADASVWSIICLGELYKRGALKDVNADPVCPVLAFHIFADLPPGTQPYLYICSTQYLDGVLNAIAAAGFNVTPLSRLQSYTITGDPAFLPPRPLVITIDDGSQSVVKLFHPRAVKRKLPYTIALVTDWMSETDQSKFSTPTPGGPDPTMTWTEAKQLYDSGLVEVIAHSDALHYQAIDMPLSDEGFPAETSRQWLREKGRLETTQEYERRIRLDMDTSRRKLAEHGFPIPSFFCWPYGEWNSDAKAIARQTGFTHFLGFDTPAIFVSRDTSADGNLPRIPVLRKDETVPLTFPSDKAEQQAWWLAFLRVAIRTQSRTLLAATLAQLTPEATAHPQAEISRGALEIMNGNVSGGTGRLLKLRAAMPFDANVTGVIDQTLALLAPLPRR
ncbi:MAG: polysaccharide deacetylase family protein [Verrucomicrobiota bacterium]|nr:polysaccharide deacetylase family protein [Verrucomicrobiota bacterium]